MVILGDSFEVIINTATYYSVIRRIILLSFHASDGQLSDTLHSKLSKALKLSNIAKSKYSKYFGYCVVGT